MSIMHDAYPYFFAQDCVTQCVACIACVCARLRIYVCSIRARACCSSYAWQLYALLLLCCLCVPVFSIQWHRMLLHDCVPARSTSRYHFCLCVTPTYGSHTHAMQAGIACVCVSLREAGKRRLCILYCNLWQCSPGLLIPILHSGSPAFVPHGQHCLHM